jgi:hypothetical protein
LNFITQSSNPNKRRHISSISKAVLAKKILDKIEQENDPLENIVPKLIKNCNEESLSKMEEPTLNEPSLGYVNALDSK